MSDPYLPAETLDHVVDLLHNTRDALRNCSLVSKSWIPRTRKHLFSIIKFPTEASLQSWKKTFPDPSSSPARYTKILTINCTPADAEVGDWIRAFSRVEHLEVGDQGFLAGGPSSLIPFYGFSPAIKSLRASFLSPPPPHVFNLVLSFPLLEHLTVIIFFEGLAGSADGSNELPTAAQPSGAPMLTGSLDIHLRGGMKPTIRQMLSLPSGIHFRKLTLTWFREEDLPLLTALVEACSHTLESLDIAGEPGLGSIDLSKATKLKDVVFRLVSWSVEWIAISVRTITPEHRDLRQIMIFALCCSPIDANPTQTVGEWMGLDLLLVKLWELHSLRPKVDGKAEQDLRRRVGRLLPEMTKRGVVDVVERTLRM